MNEDIKIESFENSSNDIIEKLIINSDIKVLNFKASLNNLSAKKNCCSQQIKIIVYQKKDLELGRMRFCCDEKLKKEIDRVENQIIKPKKEKKEIYFSSYNSIRGRVSHIIFQALLGANERKYIRESEIIKDQSILKGIHFWLESCKPEEWDKAIEDFQRKPSKTKIEKIISFYSPLYKDDKLLIEKMSNEIFSYIDNLPIEWRDEEIRIIPNHLGVSNIVIGNKLMGFKFTNKKIGLQKNHFEKLYRYFKSACKLNPEEKKNIEIFCIFSPISKEKVEMNIEHSIKKWNLEKEFQINFSLWQMNNYISLSKTKKNIEQRITWEEKLKSIGNIENK